VIRPCDVDAPEPRVDPLTQGLGGRACSTDLVRSIYVFRDERLPAEIIKIDVSLTRGVDSDPRRRALAAALTSFAEEMGITVVAEGIETHEELAALQDLGVRLGQGYFIGHPAPIADVAAPRRDARSGADPEAGSDPGSDAG
jgi:predicted signal transduction protein with EAL and GGDEF domain